MQISQVTEADMQYPLKENIGKPELLVGRATEFQKFHQWVEGMPDQRSKSWVILGRRKSGKTAFVQRLFNQLWSSNGQVIPFYYSIPESPIWLNTLALDYYQTFASHYISFVERDPTIVEDVLSLEEINEYGQTSNNPVLVRDTDYITNHLAKGDQYGGLIWRRIHKAPARMAHRFDQRILVMIDEFQYLSSYIYAREDLAGEPIRGMPGSFHSVSESKIAPMLATGSYVGWMLDIMQKHLEGGRLSQIDFSPYLADDEGLLSVYKYASHYREPINNETAVQINTLCKADPFFISCVMQSDYAKRDLTTTDGVVETVNHEVASKNAFLARTWKEYINMTVERINEKYGKQLLLHLSKHNDRSWTPKELKKELNLAEDESTIHRKLVSLSKGDLIEWGTSNIRFSGLQDNTINLILRHRFEEEIAEHEPNLIADFNQELADLTKENDKLRGQLNRIKGFVTEEQFAYAMRSRKRFRLRDFFESIAKDSPTNVKLNIIDVNTRVTMRRQDGSNKELDIVALSSDDTVLLVEAKNKQRKPNHEDVEDFLEKVAIYQSQYPGKTILMGYLSLHGFTKKGLDLCKEHGIAWSTDLQYF
ncbi:MAG: hypothetical protein AAF639_11140 [Chloroflexota bacterium]